MFLTLESIDQTMTFKTYYCVNLINFATNFLIPKKQLELSI